MDIYVSLIVLLFLGFCKLVITIAPFIIIPVLMIILFYVAYYSKFEMRFISNDNEVSVDKVVFKPRNILE